jgi:hypothetical protein
MRLAAIPLAACVLVILAGCNVTGGGSNSNPPPSISVSVSPTTASLSGSGAQSFTAAVSNDSSNAGVTWSIGSGAGALSASTSTGVTYTAPSSIGATTTVTLTATSKTDTTKTASAVITLNPPAPPPTITSVVASCIPNSVQTGLTSQCTATVTGTGAYSSTVSWSVSGVQGGNFTVGTISAAGLYTAPNTVPTTNPVTVKATSTEDTTKSGSASITLSAATNPPTITSVAASCVPNSVQTGLTSQCTATVTGTGAYSSTVSWSVSGVAGGNSTVGTISAAGLYTAPSAVPTANPVSITATSTEDGTKSGSTMVTVTSAASTIQISSLSESTANPFNLLTITGSGFDSSAIVNFSSASIGFSQNIPPIFVSQTSLIVSVPALFSAATSIGGTVNVAVQEPSNLSNSIQLQIGKLPPAPPTAPGTVTLGFLQGELLALGNYQQNISGTSGDSSQLEAALSAEINSIELFISQLTPVVSGSVASANLGSINGISLSISATDLTNTDRALIGLIQAIATLPQSTSAVLNAPDLTPRRLTQPLQVAATIQQDAQDLYDVSTSIGATQGQVSDAVANFINTSGGTNDANFGSALVILAYVGFATNPVTAAPLFATLVGEPLFLIPYLEAAPALIVDLEAAVNEFDVANAFFNAFIFASAGEEAGVAYAFIAADYEIWNENIEALCGGSLTNCLSSSPLPPYPPTLLTSLTVTQYGSGSPGSATLTGVGGTPVTGILTFSGPVQPGGVSVTVGVDNPAAQLGANNILVSGGQSSSTFTINTSGVTVETAVNISATLGNAVQTATLILIPPPATYVGDYNASFAGTFLDPNGGVYSAALDMTFTLNLVVNNDGSVAGSANFPANDTISVVSCPENDTCTGNSGSFTVTGSVTGSNGQISGNLSSGGVRPLTIGFTGVITGNSIAITGTFTKTFQGTSTTAAPVYSTLSGTISGLTLTEQ